MLLRDFSRPLVSQVLWSHQEGIEKDIRTLIFDAESSLKIYFVRNTVKNRARIDEILQTYRKNPSTTKLLRGLRIIPVPDEFDTDSAEHRSWMSKYIHNTISTDLLFAVVFGKLTAADVAYFSDHGGPFGLKFAALDEITSSGLFHGPTFERAIGTRGPPLREALAMLGATGLVGSVPNAVVKVPTLKGRFLLDLCRRIMFEKIHCKDWSAELGSIVRHLQLELPKRDDEINFENSSENCITELLYSMTACKEQFGRDLMEGIELSDPLFYSNFSWKKFASGAFRIREDFWNNPDDLDLFRQ
jgi:hypothetical protein